MSELDSSHGFVVVDASVALKWVLDDEVAIQSATRLRNDAYELGIRMLAPSLWIYEVTNALAVARARGRIDPSQSRRALGLLRDAGVVLVDPEPDDCLETSAAHGISGYDAAYVALSEAVGADLWTGDRRLVERAGGTSSRVRWIDDYAQRG